ncbi:MAG: hypothetical protein IJD16_04450 [Desulfovibrio sp.]|nr:hypothetical protein [Desulfovibrio sp.]
MSKVNTNLMQKGDYVVDNMGHIEDVLRFLEETAFNFCSHRDGLREYGYTVGGWAGFYVVLQLTRQNLSALRDNPALRGIETE